MTTNTPTTATCQYCGLTQQLPAMDADSKAVCSRCQSVLYHKTNDTKQRTLALAITGIILFIIANSYPFLSMDLEGRVQETTLLTGMIWLFKHNMLGLSVLVIGTSVIVPLLQLSSLIYILLPMQFGKLAPKTEVVLRVLRHAMPWSMMEVFLLGILVSMIKLTKMAIITPGIAIWAYSALIVVLISAIAGFNPDDVWCRIPVQPSDADQDACKDSCMITCHSCSLESAASIERKTVCPRCGCGLHHRKPNSLQRTTALVVAAIILYIPANLLPITISSKLGVAHPDTILSGAIHFMMTGAWHIALIIFVASILIPLIKLITLSYLLISIRFRHQWKPEARTRLYRFTEAVGRWSMVDVFVVTVLVALVQLEPFALVEAGSGVAYFAAVVVITMIAAESFDPRLIWDQKD